MEIVTKAERDFFESRDTDFKEGQFVYILRRHGFTFIEQFAIIDTICKHCGITVNPLYFNPTRAIDGVNVKDMRFPTPWQKIPKKFNFTEERLFEEKRSYPKEKENLGTTPEDIKEAYECGLLVKAYEYDNSRYEAEIDKINGWRIVQKAGDYTPYALNFPRDRIYASSQDSHRALEIYEAEIKRQADMTVEEWNAEKIERTLGLWKNWNKVTDELYQQTKDFLMNLPLAEIEVRMDLDQIQYKKNKNKNWINIEF